MTFSTYLAYLSISIIASVSVGPSVVLAASNGIHFGRRKAFWGVAGHVSAILVLALLSASGLSGVLLASKTIFLAIKYLGVLYLAYIAYAIWRSKGQWSFMPNAAQPPSSIHLYRKSLLLGLSNPKALVFFTALFPQFIHPESALLPQLLLLTGTSLINAFLFTFAYALVGYKLKSKLLPFINSGLLNRVTASIFMVFAVTLATVR